MNEILSNGLKSIIDLARTDHFKEAYSDAERIVFLNRVTGVAAEIDKSKPVTNHTLDNIDSLIGYMDQIDPMEGDRGFPRIFIRPTEIVCILDYQGFRVHRLTVPLTLSPILQYLNTVKGTEFQPKEAIRSLKFNLNSAILSVDPIPALQTLKFESSSSATHETKPLDEGVSKSLQSKVTGAATIPEDFTVEFFMYPAISKELKAAGSVEVKMELHVDPSKGVLTFRPFPGSIDQAILTAQQDVQQTIFKKLIDADREPLSHLVFLGKP
jgi:hypothetical protein